MYSTVVECIVPSQETQRYCIQAVCIQYAYYSSRYSSMSTRVCILSRVVRDLNLRHYA